MGTNSVGCTEWERDFDPITEQPYKEPTMAYVEFKKMPFSVKTK